MMQKEKIIDMEMTDKVNKIVDEMIDSIKKIKNDVSKFKRMKYFLKLKYPTILKEFEENEG